MSKKNMLRLLDRLEEGFIIILLMVMMTSMAVQVFFRYILNNPLVWTEELARYLYIWIAFIGAGYGVRHRSHIELTVFFKMLSPALRKIVQIAVDSIAIICYSIVIPISIPLLSAQNKIKAVGLEIPMSFVMAAVPVGCSLLVLRLCLDIVDVAKGGSESETEVYVE